jgi:hypothetical protein
MFRRTTTQCRTGVLFALVCLFALGCSQASEEPEGGYTGNFTGTSPPMTPPAGTGTPAPGGSTGSPSAPAAGTPAAPTSTEPGELPGTTAGGGAPTVVDAGASTDPGAQSDAAATPPPHEDLGVGDGSDVVTIGDSWMNYLLSGGGIEGALRRAGKSYRGYGVAGTLLLNGQIPGQYDRAKSANPNISTVIMTGGGNDIMFSGGCNTTEACEMSVMRLVAGLNELWTTMSSDGVKDVVYIRYAEGAGTTPQNTRPTTPPPPPAICVSGPIRCHSLDTTDLVMGQLLDGIHPTSAANDRIADGVLELLEMKGIRR